MKHHQLPKKSTCSQSKVMNTGIQMDNAMCTCKYDSNKISVN